MSEITNYNEARKELRAIKNLIIKLDPILKEGDTEKRSYAYYEIFIKFDHLNSFLADREQNEIKLERRCHD